MSFAVQPAVDLCRTNLCSACDDLWRTADICRAGHLCCADICRRGHLCRTDIRCAGCDLLCTSNVCSSSRKHSVNGRGTNICSTDLRCSGLRCTNICGTRTCECSLDDRSTHICRTGDLCSTRARAEEGGGGGAAAAEAQEGEQEVGQEEGLLLSALGMIV